MLAGFIIATAPLMNDFIDRKFDSKLGADLKFYLAMVVVGGGFVRTAIGRYEATSDVYTPEGLPGRNARDVEQ